MCVCVYLCVHVWKYMSVDADELFYERLRNNNA